MIDEHEKDRQYLKDLKTTKDTELVKMLRWQSCERWRRIAIRRELERRRRQP